MGPRRVRIALQVVAALAVPVVSIPPMAAAQDRSPAKAAGQSKDGRCVERAGQAVGITRAFAEYEAFLIIRQMSGNWPIQTDRISRPTYACKPDGALWSCTARAKICRS